MNEVICLYGLASGKITAGHRQLLHQLVAELRPRRPLPLLPVQPHLQPDHGPPGPEPHLPGHWRSPTWSCCRTASARRSSSRAVAWCAAKAAEAKADAKKDDKKDAKDDDGRPPPTAHRPRRPRRPHRRRRRASTSGNYFRLTATADGCLMLRRDEPIFTKYQNVDDRTGESDLDPGRATTSRSRRPRTWSTGLANYHLSADGKKLVYRAGTRYGVVDAGKEFKVGDGKVDLGGVQAARRPRAGVPPDVRRGLAHRARLVLRQEHARRRLAEDPRQVRRPGARVRRARRPQLPHRRDDRRAQHRPHLRLRRRPAARRRTAAHGDARLRLRRRPEERPRAASRASCPAAAGTTAHRSPLAEPGRGRARGRLPARHRRPAAASPRRTPTRCSPTTPAATSS